MIPFYDLKYQHKDFDKEFVNSLKKNIKQKKISYLEMRSQNLKKNFSKFNNSKYSVGVSNGTDALFLALKTFNITNGDEVIVPSHTFIASALPIIKCGAKPVFVDCEKGTFLPSFEQILKQINKKTKAIILVHIYGETVDIPLLKIKMKKNY